MCSLDCATPIDSLPEEVLCLIFDLLDLEHVKKASLTCRRWNEVLFLSPYAKRFQFKIKVSHSLNPSEEDLFWLKYLMTDNQYVLCEEELCNYKIRMNEVTDFVNHTERCYRHVRLDLQHCKAKDLQSFWKYLHPKVTESIQSLEITVLPSICDDGHMRNDKAENIITDMPELESLELAQPDDIDPQHLMFAKLKHITLTDVSVNSFDNYCSVPLRFGKVETLTVKTHLEEPLFIAICNTCPKLKELHFEQDLHIPNTTTIKHFVKLANLRRLKFYAICFNWNSYVFYSDFDLSELTQLEDLDLGFIVFGAESLIRLPASITQLSVYISEENEDNIIQTITGSLTKLQKLRLVYDINDGWYPPNNFTVTMNSLQSLHHLTLLEELVFVNAQFSESAFLDTHDLMHRLHVLRFVNCKVDRNRLQKLAQMFPKLKIEIPDSRPIIPNWRTGPLITFQQRPTLLIRSCRNASNLSMRTHPNTYLESRFYTYLESRLKND